MNKIQKHRNSKKSLQSSHNPRCRRSQNITSRAAKNSYRRYQVRENSMIKYKSIANIQHHHIDVIPREKYMVRTVRSLEGGNGEEVMGRYLQSVSDRFCEDGSLKIGRSSKTKNTMPTRNNEHIHDMKRSVRNSLDFMKIYERTRSILNQHRIREQKWKIQKQEILKQLVKCKNKLRKKKKVQMCG